METLYWDIAVYLFIYLFFGKVETRRGEKKINSKGLMKDRKRTKLAGRRHGSVLMEDILRLAPAPYPPPWHMCIVMKHHFQHVLCLFLESLRYTFKPSQPVLLQIEGSKTCVGVVIKYLWRKWICDFVGGKLSPNWGWIVVCHLTAWKLMLKENVRNEFIELSNVYFRLESVFQYVPYIWRDVTFVEKTKCVMFLY